MDKSVVSPDGLLELVIEKNEGDILIGFRGLPWHTHADILGQLYKLDDEAAVDRFIAQLVSGKSLICVLRKNRKIVDAWITDNPSREKATEGEELEIRRWDENI